MPGQDGYPGDTVSAYVLLFTVIATHLKTRSQLWRLLGAIVAMGVLISAYAALRNYGHDFLNLSEPTGRRVTAFLGTWIFAAAVMVMTIPITAAAAVIALLNFPERKRATQNYLTQRLPALAGDRGNQVETIVGAELAQLADLTTITTYLFPTYDP